MVSLDTDKSKVLAGLEFYKDNINEMIQRLKLINSDSPQWEKNAARECVNNELFPAIRKTNLFLNDIVWNYEYDPTVWSSFKDYEIKHIKKELEETNELLIQNGICFVYKPPLVK